MQTFSIKDIENLSGIKAHTLRAWEQRYGLGKTRRSVRNMPRIYNNDDLKKMLIVSHLYERGYKVSYLAKLHSIKLRQLLNKEIAETGEVPYIKLMLEAALGFESDTFEHLLESAFKENGFENALKQVVYPYLKKVGNLWLNDETIPAQEHFASSIIRKRIITAIDSLPKKALLDKSPVTILFGPANEYHEITLLVAEYFLRSRQLNLINLGMNTSIDVLKQFVSAKKISTFFFHPVTNFTGMTCQEYVDELSNQLPLQQIIMAGPLTRFISDIPPNVRLLKSEEAMYKFLLDS